MDDRKIYYVYKWIRHVKQREIRKCLEGNSKLFDIKNYLFYQNICFIYKQDYDRLNSQSTIETVA